MAATTAFIRLHNSSFGTSTGAVGVGSNAANTLHSQLSRSLERILEEAHLSGELILTNRKLKDFPKTGTKFNLSDTVIADLSRNRFCELPEEVTSFAFLETLLLYHNTIRIIPESIKNLTSLTYLDLRSNQLSALPREICFLPLQVLLISNNRLSALPDELGRMDRLTDLDASYNQLTALPARIGELRSLRSFSLRSNQLMYLPREITTLNLVSLNVSNNRIASLPLEIRQMSTLVEFNLENNPLTSPPASLCERGLVHVFKYLETQAIKDEKCSRAGGNYDGYTTLRRAPRHNSSGNILDTQRIGRPYIDSGYSTCDGIDKRWSQDLPTGKAKNSEAQIPRLPTKTTSANTALSNCQNIDPMDVSHKSIVDESLFLSATVGKSLNLADSPDWSPEKKNSELMLDDSTQTLYQSQTKLMELIEYAQSNGSTSSSPKPDENFLLESYQQNGNLPVDEKQQKNLGNIQTYREYKEALKQQRNQDVNVYKAKDQQKTFYDPNEKTNSLNSNSSGQYKINEEDDVNHSVNGMNVANNLSLSKSHIINTTNGYTNGNGSTNGHDETTTTTTTAILKKPVQKVVPSRNIDIVPLAPSNKVNLTQENEKNLGTYAEGVDCLGYVKPNSPMKISNGCANNNSGILVKNNKFNTNGNNGLISPVNGSSIKVSTPKSHRSVTWNHGIPPEKLSFTMRREFDRQREETELMTQLRLIIESRLKIKLPEDIASALTDGVVLCHLANYVKPRSVVSIHVPSPGVSKLTMARCRRNVDNFLEACRRIGVDENLICCSADVLEGKGAVQVAITVGELFRLYSMVNIPGQG